MPNNWSDNTIKVTKANPHFINGYGFLYTFDCIMQGRPFTHMSQIFVPKELGGDAASIHKHFKKMEGSVGINPITSINRNYKNNTEESAIERAKSYKNSRDKEKLQAKELKEKKDLERGEPADPEWISNLIKQKLEEWKSQDKSQNKKASSDWYNNAKMFVKAVIEDSK